MWDVIGSIALLLAWVAVYPVTYLTFRRLRKGKDEATANYWDYWHHHK